jgi:CBS domain-containing protein
VNEGTHRVAVVDPENHSAIRGIVTPCGILRAIRDKLPELGEIGTAPIGSLFNICAGTVQTAHKDQTAQYSLQRMLKFGHSGMPVVDDNGVMVGAVCFSQLRCIASMNPEDAEYALEHQPTMWLATRDPRGEEDVDAYTKNMSVLPSDSLSTAITMLAYSRAHRMYVVDKERRPIGVITIRSL